MPVLPNPKHETFAQARAKGKSADEAYKAAGYRAHSGNAARLSGNERVRSRVAELQDKGAQRAAVTIDTIAAELDEARDLAKTEKQSSPMIQATLGKAKLFGLITDKVRHSGTVGVVTLTAKDLGQLNANELAALEAAYPVLEKLGIVGSAPTGEAASAG